MCKKITAEHIQYMLKIRYSEVRTKLYDILKLSVVGWFLLFMKTDVVVWLPGVHT